MALGMAPLIPLNRVVPTPDARFQRFGVNDSELFGTPILDLNTPGLVPAPRKVERPARESAPQAAAAAGARKSGAKAPEKASRTQGPPTPEPPVGYDGRTGVARTPSASFRPGAYLDLTT